MPGRKSHSANFKTVWGKRTKGSGEDVLREVGVSYKRSLNFGRHLSFSINDSSIHMAVVFHTGWKKRIIDVRKVYIPNELIGAPGQDSFIAQTIDDFLGEHGRWGARVSVAISGKETAFRTFLTPLLKKRELASAIQFEAKHQIPFPLKDSCYDFRPVYKVVGAGRTRLKIALHAVTKRSVNEHLQPFRQKNVAVTHVYHSQDVIGQLLRYLPDFNEEASYTLINIDRHHCEISFYRGCTLEFFHVGSAGSSFLDNQADKSNFDSFAQTLAEEVQTSLDYYSGQYPLSSTDRIYVYGDMAYSSELLQFLDGQTGFEFERFPVDVIDCLPKGECRFAQALPVCLPALASATCNVRLANLLPAKDRLKHLKRKVHTLAQVFLVLLTVLLAAGWAMMKAKTTIAENNLVSLDKRVNSFKSSDAYHTYNVLKRQIAVDRSFLEKAKESPSYLSLNLKELSLLTPKPIRLSHLSYETEDPSRNLTIHGVVTSRKMPPEVVLAEYIETLSCSPFFENVRLTRHVKRRLGKAFEIEFQIEMRGIV